jgi:hypothetical protein
MPAHHRREPPFPLHRPLAQRPHDGAKRRNRRGWVVLPCPRRTAVSAKLLYPTLSDCVTTPGLGQQPGSDGR